MNFVQHQDSSRGEDNDDDTKDNTKYVENEKRSQISETETILDRVETKGSNSYDDQATVDLFIGERVAGVEMKDEQNKEEDNQAGTNNNVEVGEESDGTDWEPLECNGC